MINCLRTFSRPFTQTACLRSKYSLYITTPIFYVNANPHLGHLYSMLLCDTRNRWEKLKPDSLTYFTTGTDEHGLKIQAAAEKQGIDPKDLCDKVSLNFGKLAADIDIDYDRFIRTTDPDHDKAVKFFWNLMKEKDLLYEGSHSGWYSVSDETFYPETQIEPIEGLENRFRSKETKSEVVFQEETNYFFKLSQFQSQLIDYLEHNPEFVIPASKHQQLLNELKSNKLSDLSVSRPSSRLKWGIQVPNDPSQKIYVWFDALINYITSCGFPDKFIASQSGALVAQDTMWPATHIVGKDILRFHCIYWPIFLMAAGIELPKQVVVHSHWLSEGFKMSKSLGNVVDPQETAKYYGKDPLRFFLMEYSNIESDCNYQEEAFYFTRENIISKYANLVTRCGGTSFNISQSVSDMKNGKYTNIDEIINSHSIQTDIPKLLEVRDEIIDKCNTLYAEMDQDIKCFQQSKAISKWWSLVEKGNELFQLGQPWVYAKKISKQENENYQLLRNYYTFLASEVCRMSSILIQPIMPELSMHILDRLGVDKDSRKADNAVFAGDMSYGEGANDKKHKIPIARIPMRGLE